jgi:tetratricopeptide (TPR) repeat protein
MYIDKYWGNYIGGSDDSLNLVAFLEDQKKEEIPLSEIFAKIGLDKQDWDFHRTMEYLEFTHSDGVEMDFHFAIDVITDLAAILLECSVSGSVNLHDLDSYNTPSRRIRVIATAEEHDAMNKALADFAKDPLSYDLHDLMDDDETKEMAEQVEALRKELYEAIDSNRSCQPNPEQAVEEQNMDILQQCQKWHENDEYQKIIDALEAIPADERTPEMDSELARAYNNWGGIRSNRDALKKAIALLKPHEEYFAGDYFWNFRMGYSYYQLDQEGRALRYFEQALEARPDDEDTKELIDWCKKRIALPQFSECFRERTQDWWETFAEIEAELRQIMDEDKDHTRGAEIVAQMEETLNLAFDEVSFEMGFNGEKYELILTPEGDKVKLFELVYFQRHVPKEVLEHWNILVGRQPIQYIGLRTDDGWDISGDDVQIWLEDQGENSFTISAYCEKLLPMLQKEKGRAWWMLTTLTDQVLGEIPHMRYIDTFDVLENPKEEAPIFLSELPDKLKKEGMDLSIDPENYLECYLGYQMEPNEDPNVDWRLDVIAGSTNCVPLINGYLNANNDCMDNLHADGAVAGFFCYSLDTLREEEGTQKIFDFRDKLEELFTTGDGPEVLTLTGGATGLYCGYVDFIAWDIRTALQMAKEFFEDSDIPWASFHTFRREAGSVCLKELEEDELEKTLTGMDYIPYTQQNAEAFFQQLDQWNDEDEYTRCIQALNVVPENWRDYRFAYALARALENYAIIGDHNEGTPNYKGDKALLRTIEVLESVQEEGQDKAEWNMRMAYAYQYLHGQEEKAIPYAQRWAELDPEDEDAPAVIRACQEEITKRAEVVTEDENADEADHRGVFTGFVLLSKGKWDKQQFIRDMKDKWDITVDEYDASEEKDDNALVFEVGDILAAVSLADHPIPGGEAEANAENNYMWKDAVKAAREHRAHIMVAVLGKEEDLLEKGKLYTKLVAACCRQKYATGVYTSGVVFEPRFYEGFADMMKDDDLPIFNWIWFGLYQNENGMNGYTYGMDVFGKDEMEVLGTNAEPGDLRDFLASVASYVLENDVDLHDGETIGFTKDDKHTFTRSPGVSLPEDQMTLKISWESSDDDGEEPKNEESSVPEVYTEAEMESVEGHIQQYFGKFENVFHELSSPDIHVDICVVPPSEERDYYTLVTMGMGAHRMNVPEELAEYKLKRAELAIALPKDWKLKHEDLKNEWWYWPIRLLKDLARLPIASDTWLGFGHTMDHEENFAENTKLCAAILTGPQGTEEGSEVCTLPDGDEVNFYQVIPLYRDELEYKMEHDADTLLDKMDGISFVVNPNRQDAITRGTLCSGDDEDNYVVEMDDADWHLESIQEKNLPVNELSAYNHMAIYLRWCMEHDLMGEEFLAEYGEVVQKVKANPANVDLREFIRNELDGQLLGPMFNQKGRAFASYYYGESDSPYFPSDIDNYALEYFGSEQYHSEEFQDEAYLFVPFDEEYYQAMAKVIEKRFINWQEQDFDEDTLEPSELAKAMMEYLGCECTYFPAMKDDDPIASAYSYAKRDSTQEGFVPVLIKTDDEILWECLIMNSDPDSDGEDDYTFNPDKVEEYRKKMLAAPIKDGKAVLEEFIGQRKEEVEDDDLDWEEILGQMKGGYDNCRFSSYWNSDTSMTYPLILAKIPVKNPWEIFAYLPFGNWNECPDTPELMAVAKYWFEQYGAIPAALTHDELEFELPAPVPKENVMKTATEQYGFCPDIVDQEPEDATIGNLADVLWQSTVWYFWWD